MKRIKNIYKEICDVNNLIEAAHKARRGKRNRPEVVRFFENFEAEIMTLYFELISRTYQPSAYRTFTIYDTKPRLISAAPFRDRVVHHALCNIIEPVYEKSFIFDSYASRKGKGTHAAIKRFQEFMSGADYVLKCDIRKYFPSIDHQVLKALLRRKIGCEGTLWLLDTILDNSNEQVDTTDWFPGDDLLSPLSRRRGLPIGNQTSQFLGNVYLDALDHFVKEELQVKRYIRYVDDFVLLADDKATLWEWKAQIDRFLALRLRLRVHTHKHFIQPVTLGTAFLGQRIFPTHRRTLPASGYRFATNLRRMARDYAVGALPLSTVQQRISAWLGHAQQADSFGLRTALLFPVKFVRAPLRQAAAPGTTTTRTTSAAPTETGTPPTTGTTTTVSVCLPQHSSKAMQKTVARQARAKPGVVHPQRSPALGIAQGKYKKAPRRLVA